MLADVLVTPPITFSYTPDQWSALIRCAREAQLLARLYQVFADANALDSVPSAPRAHLISAHRQAEKQVSQVRSELTRIEQDLTDFGGVLVVLKGGAYIYAGLKCGAGRTLSDIDLLVEKKQLAVVEKLLKRFGWFAENLDDHDERYYREWAHEIPPLKHVNRGAVIDLHHNIFPVKRMHVEVERLLERVWLPDPDRAIAVLDPLDMLLHSATHLFFEGEFEVGLRDLSDMALLMDGFTTQQWDALPARALTLGLELPLFFALRYAAGILGARIPAATMERVDEFGPAPVRRAIFDWLFTQVLRAHHPIELSRWFFLARFILYLRGHLLKLPLRLLIPHLARKTLLATGAALGIRPQRESIKL